MTKINDAWPEEMGWIHIDGSHQLISDYKLVNTPSVWVAPENVWTEDGISPRDRISHAFNLLNAFLGSNHHALTQQQSVELQRVLNILADNPTVDEDRDWADETIKKWINNQQEMPAENVKIIEENFWDLK